MYPVTRRELIRRSGLAAAGLAAAPVLGSTQRASAQGGVELVFWDSLFIEDEAIPIDQWFITQAIARFQEEFPDIRINRVAQSSDIATYDQVLQAANLASNGPDVLTHYAGGGILSFAQFLDP